MIYDKPSAPVLSDFIHTFSLEDGQEGAGPPRSTTFATITTFSSLLSHRAQYYRRSDLNHDDNTANIAEDENNNNNNEDDDDEHETIQKMMWKVGITTALAVGAQAAGVSDLVAEGMLTGRSSLSLESRMDDIATNHVVVSRQTSTVLNGTGTMNMTAWDIEVNAACQGALSKLAQATNPSGTCTCYNLPVLNNNTGAFEADLRLYQISAARDDFAGISQNQIQVSLSYNGASVSPVSAQTAAAKVVAKRQNTNVQLLQTYMFVGQIDQEKLQTTNMNM